MKSKTTLTKKKTKPKPKQTIASLQKEIRALKRTRSNQLQLINYLERRALESLEMYEETLDKLNAALSSLSKTKDKNDK